MGRGKRRKTPGQQPKRSGGQKKKRAVLRQIKFLETKVSRWDKYKAAGRSVSENSKNRSRYTWNTAGLLREIARLNKYLTKIANKT